MDVKCDSKWRMNDQKFDVTVHWTVSSNVEISSIDYFEIKSRQYDTNNDYIQGSYKALENVKSQV